MSINRKTRQFESDLFSLINRCGLPPCIVRMAMTPILEQVRVLEEKAIQEEQAAEQEHQDKPQEELNE